MKKSLAQEIMFGTAFLACLIIPIVVLVASLLSGCEHTKTACQVVRAASTACTLIEFVGDDGTVERYPVAPDELRSFAKQSAIHRSDAGVSK